MCSWVPQFLLSAISVCVCVCVYIYIYIYIYIHAVSVLRQFALMVERHWCFYNGNVLNSYLNCGHTMC